MNLIRLLKDGQEYMRICPKDAHLKTTFPEIKIIHLTRLGIRFMPPLAIIVFVWQYYMHAPLIASVITLLVALSLPVQGILWLGKRSQMPLPLTLLTWFNELKQKLILHRILSEKASMRPTYMELMKLLKLCQKHFGHYDYEKRDSRHPKKEANKGKKRK